MLPSYQERFLFVPTILVRVSGCPRGPGTVPNVRRKHSDFCFAKTLGETSWIGMSTGKMDGIMKILPQQAQTRVPSLAGNDDGIGTVEDDGHLYGYDAEYGMGGDSSIHNTSMINIARYVAVAPRNVSTSLRDLPFMD